MSKNQELKIVKLDIPELDIVEKSKAEQIKSTFLPMTEMLSEFESDYSALIEEAKKGVTEEITSKAKRLRLDIAQVRIKTEHIRVEQKQEYLRAGKAIDGVSNILKWAVTDKENELKKIENHFEILEKERLQKLQSDRVVELSKYLTDAEERDLSSMDADVWKAYLQTKKTEHEDRVAAEKKAEQDRIEAERKRAEEIEKQKVENERLKKEAEEREKEAEKERKKREAQEKKRQAEEKKRREKEAEERRLIEEKAAKEAEEKEAQLKKEREEKEAIQRKLREKEAEEKAAKEAEEARVQSELNKGDAAKVKDLTSDLESLKNRYVFKSSKNKKMMSDVSTLLDKIINHISN